MTTAHNALIWRHKRVGYTAKQSPRVCVPNICLLCVRDSSPSRLCRHRPPQQTVDLNNNNYLKTTPGEKPDDKAIAKEMSWLAKLIVPNDGVTGIKRKSVVKAVFKTESGRHRYNLLKLPCPDPLPPY